MVSIACRGIVPHSGLPTLNRYQIFPFITRLIIVMTIHRGGPSIRPHARPIVRSAGDLHSTDEPLDVISEFANIVLCAHEQAIE